MYLAISCVINVCFNTLILGSLNKGLTILTHLCLFSYPAEDSFETSSTSSGECYENTGPSTADMASENYENTEENRNELEQPESMLLFKMTEISSCDYYNPVMLLVLKMMFW